MRFLLILSAQIDYFFVSIYSLDPFAHSWYVNENSS